MAGARRVSLSFASRGLGVPATEVAAARVGDDRYRVSGIYTATVGEWQVGVRSTSATAATRTAAFVLPVTAKPGKPEKAPEPVITASTWAYGIGEVLLVIGALLTASVVSRRLARGRLARRPPVDGHGRVAVVNSVANPGS